MQPGFFSLPTLMNQFIYIGGLFLILLTIGGNFLEETFGCQTRRLLKKNKYAKNIFLLLLVFFTINFSDRKSSLTPFEKIKSTIIVWLAFLIFKHLTVELCILIFISLSIMLILIEFSKYYKNGKNKNTQIVNNINNSIYILDCFLLLLFIFGILQYYFNLKRQKKEFKLFEFLFGIKHCKN